MRKPFILNIAGTHLLNRTMASTVEVYQPVELLEYCDGNAEDISEDAYEERHLDTNGIQRHGSKNNSCYQWIYRYIAAQTSLPSLILYAYLFWYLFIMFCFGIKNMPIIAWLNGMCHQNICKSMCIYSNKI